MMKATEFTKEEVSGILNQKVSKLWKFKLSQLRNISTILQKQLFRDDQDTKTWKATGNRCSH